MTSRRIGRTACAAAMVGSGAAQGPSSDTVKPFNGTSLAGWRTEGSAQWRVAGGELVGSAAAGPGSLALDKSYQDMILRFAYRCENCERRFAFALTKNLLRQGDAGQPSPTPMIVQAVRDALGA